MIFSRANWMNAIGWWRLGHPEPLAQMLRGKEDIHADARESLARIIEGSLKRRRGRAPDLPADNSLSQAFQLRHAFDASVAAHRLAAREARANGTWKRGGPTPSEKAIAELSKKFGMKKGAVKRIIYSKLAKQIALIESRAASDE